VRGLKAVSDSEEVENASAETDVEECGSGVGPNRSADLDRAGEARRVEFPPDLRIGRLDRIHASLTEALNGDGGVVLDMASVEAVDTAGLQLVLAFAREAKSQGKAVSWTGFQPLVAEAIDLLGMAGKLGLRPDDISGDSSCQ